MKAVLCSLLAITLTTVATAADARYGENDPVAGTYYGNFKTQFAQGPAEAQIRALGNNQYDGFLLLKRVAENTESIVTIANIHPFEMMNGEGILTASHPNDGVASAEDRNLEFSFPGMIFLGKVTQGRVEADITGSFLRPGDAKLTLTKSTPRSSPTLGAKAPDNAVVLFDGKPNDKWKDLKWSTKDGVLEVGKGNITTKDSFENALLHLEFRTPFMPEARGQARGNSGVYLRSVFEVQVLDSFGKFPLESNDCGGIYQVSAPDWHQVNACLPPGTWQTYDITYRQGSEQENRLPTISVMHNGKVTVSNAEVPAGLVANGTGGGEVDGGFLMLQDHGNAVQFRNIWVQPID